jgi:cytochrome b6-f complex iron-sulfur subunit
VSTSRRAFFKGLAGTAGLGAAAGLKGCAPGIDPAPVLDVPEPVSGRIHLVVARYPDLSRVGGAVTLRLPDKSTLLVVRPGEERYAVFSSLCTHVGCPLGFEGGTAVCPCHGSRFGMDGQVLNPPATVGLTVYRAFFDANAGVLSIDLAAGDPGFPAVVGGKVVFPFESYPQLRTPGGVVSGKPQGLGRLLYVFALEDGSYSALDGTCTHQACTVGYTEGAAGLRCPCHNSTFTRTGEVTAPPATLPLRRFPAAADASGVVVTVT